MLLCHNSHIRESVAPIATLLASVSNTKSLSKFGLANYPGVSVRWFRPLKTSIFLRQSVEWLGKQGNTRYETTVIGTQANRASHFVSAIWPWPIHHRLNFDWFAVTPLSDTTLIVQVLTSVGNKAH